MRLTDDQISAELSALREVPSERFAAELDAWAAQGFPSLKQLEGTEPRRRNRVLGLAARRPALAALTSAAAIVALVGISVAGYLGSRNDQARHDVGQLQPFSSK